jgi:formiminoglutamase
MSGGSSSRVGWSTRLEPVRPPADALRRADDPRLAEVIEFWDGGPLRPSSGRPVLIGFPQDEGVRLNHGRVGAAEAPQAIRHALFRLTPWDARAGIELGRPAPIDLGDVLVAGGLEASQKALAEIVAMVRSAGGVPVVVGGGHETALGHYLGHAASGKPTAVVNFDAHLDVRPCLPSGGHSGSSFRQAMEQATNPLRGHHYVCLGAQPHAVARDHLHFLQDAGATVRWADDVREDLAGAFTAECDRLAEAGCQLYVTCDADAVCEADVPGVSAPNPVGLRGRDVIACARLAGRRGDVAGLDVVEVNPRLDPGGRSVRWAALLIWHFFVGLAERSYSAI